MPAMPEFLRAAMAAGVLAAFLPGQAAPAEPETPRAAPILMRADQIETEAVERDGLLDVSVTVRDGRGLLAQYIDQARDGERCVWDIAYELRNASATEATITLGLGYVARRLQCRIFEDKVYTQDGNIKIDRRRVPFPLDVVEDRAEVSLEIAARPGLEVAIITDTAPTRSSTAQLDPKLIRQVASASISRAMRIFLDRVMERARKDLTDRPSREGTAFRRALNDGSDFDLRVDFRGDNLLLRFRQRPAAATADFGCPVTVGEKWELTPDGKLQGVPFCATPNMGRPMRQPEVIVLHFPASVDAEGVVRIMQEPNFRASTHFLIDRDGSIVQLVPTGVAAWHAGRSRWMGRSGLNNFSIAIELVNGGRLKLVDDTWQTWSGQSIPEDEVVVRAHKFEPKERHGWHTYTDAQMDSLVRLIGVLRKRYPVRIEDIVGNDDIAPLRKVDPGPAFDWEELRRRLGGR